MFSRADILFAPNAALGGEVVRSPGRASRWVQHRCSVFDRL